MKTLKKLVSYAVMPIIPALFIIACTKETVFVNQGGTTETTSAGIIGKLWNGNGTPAAQARVRLTPANFNPYAPVGDTKIDSTTTDNEGMYSFTPASSGFYNMSARSGETVCFEDSVYGSEDGQSRVKDDTLTAPGSITGVVSLRPGDDNLKIIILVLGTTIYGSPKDSSGAFCISSLAKGDYVLRIFTTEKDYGFLDTLITVSPAETTAIAKVLRLPFVGVPDVGPVAARMDSSMMLVSLSWPRYDTSNIAAFYVFRNTGMSKSPYAILKNTDTCFTDDVILIDPDSLVYGDTLRYSVAALGKDRTLGRPGNAPDILLRSCLTPSDTVSLSAIGIQDLHSFIVDKNRNFIMCGTGWIRKVDQAGRLIADYTETGVDLSKRDFFIRVWSDVYGNVYIDNNSRGTLMKFSPDLKLVSEKLLRDFTEVISNISFTANDNGLAYLFTNAATGNGPTFIYAFDSTFSIVQSDSIPEEAFDPAMHNDTFYFKDDGNSESRPTGMTAYDIHFQKVREWDIGDILTRYRTTQSKTGDWEMTITGDGTSFVCVDAPIFYESGTQDGNVLFLAVDQTNKLKGRYRLFGNRYFLDGKDRMYLLNYGKREIYVYKINE